MTRRTLVRMATNEGLAEVQNGPFQVFTPKLPEFPDAKCGADLG